MNHLAVAFLVFSLTVPILAENIPNEKKDYVEKLSNAFSAFDSAKSKGMLKTLLESLFKEKIVKKEDVISSLDNFEELKKKILKLKKEDKNGQITFGDLEKIVESNFEGMKEEEKRAVENQLLALLLTEMKGTHQAGASIQDRLKDVVRDYLKTIAEFEPNKPLKLSEELKKELGLSEASKYEEFLPENISKLIEQKGLSPKASMDLLSNILNTMPEKDVEVPQVALAPIYKNLYDSMIQVEPKKSILPDNFINAIDMIKNFRKAQIQRAIENGQVNTYPNLILRDLIGKDKFNGGGQASLNDFIGSKAAPATVEVTEDLKTCLAAVKQKRFNVELRIQNSRCASTPVSINPSVELENIKTKKNGFCKVKLATASHCIEGYSLNNSIIQTKIGRKFVNARVIKSETVDLLEGEPVAGSNPDLATIEANFLCSDAAQLNFARIPTKAELATLMGKDSIPLVMQQNSEINANIDGDNGATIGGTGSLRKEKGSIGNFLRFNTNSDINKKSGIRGDSRRIRPGDSGGSALTCKMSSDSQVMDYLYLGAISHIDVRNDQYAGMVGGVASGRSLEKLSSQMHGDLEMAAVPSRIATSTISSSDSSRQPAFTHKIIK